MAKHNFKNRSKFEKSDDDSSFYANALKKAASETEKFKAVAGVDFTINNARNILIDAAKFAVVFYGQPLGDQYRDFFNRLLKNLPKGLDDISTFIKIEVMAHLRLAFGKEYFYWLTNSDDSAALIRTCDDVK